MGRGQARARRGRCRYGGRRGPALSASRPRPARHWPGRGRERGRAGPRRVAAKASRPAPAAPAPRVPPSAGSRARRAAGCRRRCHAEGRRRQQREGVTPRPCPLHETVAGLAVLLHPVPVGAEEEDVVWPCQVPEEPFIQVSVRQRDGQPRAARPGRQGEPPGTAPEAAPFPAPSLSPSLPTAGTTAVPPV